MLFNYDFPGTIFIIRTPLYGISLSPVQILRDYVHNTILIHAGHVESLNIKIEQLPDGISPGFVDTKLKVSFLEDIIFPEILTIHMTEPVLMIHTNKPSVLRT